MVFFDLNLFLVADLYNNPKVISSRHSSYSIDLNEGSKEQLEILKSKINNKK